MGILQQTSEFFFFFLLPHTDSCICMLLQRCSNAVMMQVPGPWLDSPCRVCEKSQSSPSLRATLGRSPAEKTHFFSNSSPKFNCGAYRCSDSRGLWYLGGALAHGVDQLLDDHVHALDARLLQFDDLLLHDGLKRHVGGEESSPAKKGERLLKKKKYFSTNPAQFILLHT